VSVSRVLGFTFDPVHIEVRKKLYCWTFGTDYSDSQPHFLIVTLSVQRVSIRPF